jgi:GDSL-like Lipase/Acylhydrolase family
MKFPKVREGSSQKRTSFKATIAIAAALLFLSTALTAQTFGYRPHVSILGNSIALFEAGLQANIFPTLPPSNVYIFGHESLTCASIKQLITYDAFGSSYAPRNPDIVVLANDTTNDVEHDTDPQALLSCLVGTVQELLDIKPSLKIVLLTTPPWTHYNPCSGEDNDPSVVQIIASYNALMPQVQQQFPHNVRVLDANTPFLDGLGDGWADPSLMTGACGIHPGPAGQWTGGWPTFDAVFRATVLNSNLAW